MQSVFPWTAAASPLVALGIVLASLAYLVVVAGGYAWLARRIERRAEGASRQRFMGPQTWEHVRTAARLTALGLSFYFFAYAATWVWAPLRESLLVPSLSLLPALLLGGTTLLAAAVATAGVRQLVLYLRGELEHKPPKTYSSQVVAVLDVSLRYTVYVVTAATLVAVGLGVLGFDDVILEAMRAWLAEKAGAIVLLLVLVAAAWLGGRLIRALTTDISGTSSRLSPEALTIVSVASRGLLYAFLLIVGLFTLLQAVGLGSIGGTMVVVMSSFIGIVVAMAATGSIGNALAGVVLIGFKPIHRGDRIVLQDGLVADVEEVGVMFTTVRTVPGERVEVPNNLMLAGRIRNLSRSGPHAIVVKMGIGYEVPVSRVRDLAKAAALKTEQILDAPEPKLFAASLGSYAIEYELHAYTTNPRHVAVRSDLIENLQKVFYASGVEIMTPDQHALRRSEDPTRRVPVSAPADTVSRENQSP